MKKNNKKGFTLAELLIVVAIIAVLTAIAIPVFTSQLEKSKESTDQANIRSAYLPISEVVPDDWFDECKQIMDLMDTNIRGVFSFDRHNDWY